MKWPEIIAVLKFALGILREHRLVKDLQREHKLNLYQALKLAKNTARREHEEAKKKGGEYLAYDTNSMLGDSGRDLFFPDEHVADRGED